MRTTYVTNECITQHHRHHSLLIIIINDSFEHRKNEKWIHVCAFLLICSFAARSPLALSTENRGIEEPRASRKMRAAIIVSGIWILCTAQERMLTSSDMSQTMKPIKESTIRPRIFGRTQIRIDGRTSAVHRQIWKENTIYKMENKLL